MTGSGGRPSADRTDSPGSRRPLDRVFSDLKERVERRLPGFSARGPEDPGWVLLEVLAEALAEIEDDVEVLEERLFPRVLEALGEESRWAAGARGAVVFVPEEGRDEPVSIPRGTMVSAPRKEGEPRLSFVTEADACSSRARLLRVVTCGGDRHAEIIPYPQSGWDGEPTPLFAGRADIARHLYLGDAALLHLREKGALVLEWPGQPQVLWEGRWEYSVRGGWRAARVRLEEAVIGGTRRAVLVRVTGPMPDLAEARIESARGPWLRLSLPGDRRTTLQQPRWLAAEPASASLRFPRAVARVLSHGGERWEDHSLTAQKIVPVESPESWDPAVYLGWDAPFAASVYWDLAGRPAPAGWGGSDGSRAPVLVWEHSSGRGFRPLEVEDSTRALTRRGCVAWSLPREWTPLDLFGEGLHWVRARWISGAYRSGPVARAVIPHAAEVRQARPHEGHVFEVEVDSRGRAILPLAFPEGEPEPFSRLEVRGPDGEWRLLSHEPIGAPAGERLDPSTVENGASAPGGSFTVARLPRGGFAIDVGARWAGPLALRFPLLRAVLGERGNVAAGTLRVVEAEIPGLRQVLQPLAASGGRDGEGPDAFRRRVFQEWKAGDRAVTPDDYRRLVKALDPEVARVEIGVDPLNPSRVIVCAVAEEPCLPGRLSPATLEWLVERLSARAPLGTVVEVVEPMYVSIEVSAWRPEDAPPLPEEGRRAFEERLRRFLHPLRGGSGRGFPAGRWLQAEDLHKIMIAVMEGESSSPAGEGLGRARPRSAATREAGEWRFEVRPLDGRPLPEGMEDGALGRGWPFLVPVLERLRFDPPSATNAE